MRAGARRGGEDDSDKGLLAIGELNGERRRRNYGRHETYYVRLTYDLLQTQWDPSFHGDWAIMEGEWQSERGGQWKRGKARVWRGGMGVRLRGRMPLAGGIATPIIVRLYGRIPSLSSVSGIDDLRSERSNGRFNRYKATMERIKGREKRERQRQSERQRETQRDI